MTMAQSPLVLPGKDEKEIASHPHHHRTARSALFKGRPNIRKPEAAKKRWRAVLPLFKPAEAAAEEKDAEDAGRIRSER